MGRKRLFNDKEKWCNRCKKWLPLDAFGDNRRTASGKQDYCKTCHSAYFDTFWGKVSTIDKMLWEKFAMQPGEYLDQWRSQNNKCPICEAALVLYQRDTRVRVIDSAKVLVCSRCDEGLEAFGNDARILQRAAQLVSSISGTASSDQKD